MTVCCDCAVTVLWLIAACNPMLCRFHTLPQDVENKLPFAKRHAERTQKGFFLAVGVRRSGNFDSFGVI